MRWGGGLIVRVMLGCIAGLGGCSREVNDSASSARATAPILLFNGRRVSPNDVAAIATILQANRLTYAAVDSGRLNQMSAAELGAHQLLIVPGGNFITMGEGLDASTMNHVRGAVQHGLNYLGICGGAFLASDSGYNSFNLTAGVRFKFYAAEEQGIRKAAVAITTPDGARLENYWEDGPQLAGWGEVVGKYPDGTPAIVQGRVGDGCVILTGTHPEAPANWRDGMTFTTPASETTAFATTLIDAALHRTALPHF